MQLLTIAFATSRSCLIAMLSHGGVCGRSFEGGIKQLQTDRKPDDIHFVIGRFSDKDMANKTCPHGTMVRDLWAELAEVSPLGAWVHSDDLPMQRGSHHHIADGCKTMGQCFADKAIALIQGK